MASAMASSPRVLTIPASARFLPVLIDALMNDRLGLGFKPSGEPLALVDVTMYLPTGRAQDVGRLRDAMTMRQVDWGDLDGLVQEELDTYWQLTLQFLRLSHGPWQGVLAERNRIEPAARRDLLLTAETKRLETHKGPV